MVEVLAGGRDQPGQDGDQGAGALLHAGLASAGFLDVAADVGGGDRTRRGPRRPAGGIFQRPLDQVEVERADHEHDCVHTAAGFAVGQHPDALLPGLGHLVSQGEGVDAGMVTFEVDPEQGDQQLGLVDQRSVVEHGGAFGQVVHEHVADRLAGDRVAVDHLRDRQLAPCSGLPHGRRLAGEAADRVQDFVGERQRGARPTAVAALCRVGGEVGQVEPAQVLAGHDHHAGQQVQRLGGVFPAVDAGRNLLLQLGERVGLVALPERRVDTQQATARQPRVGGPDRAQHDHHAEALGQPPPDSRAQPRWPPGFASLVGAAEQPSSLPVVAREGLQPVQDPGHCQLVPPPFVGGWRGQQRLREPDDLLAGAVLAPIDDHW